MPFQSKSQKRFLFAKKPQVAKEFASKTSKGKELPEKINPERRKRAVQSLIGEN